MTQNAVVTKLISRHVAEVEVERGTACGGTCESCEACVFQSRIRAEALNKVSALPGQKVVIESKTSDVLGAAALLYLVPAQTPSQSTVYPDGEVVETYTPSDYCYLPSRTGATVVCAVGLAGVMAVLSLNGCGYGTKTDLTMRRLRIGEGAANLWWMALNAVCLLFYWAVMAAVTVLVLQLRIRNIVPDNALYTPGRQTLLLAVYASSFLHHLMPVRDTLVWAEDGLLLALCAAAAARFSQAQRRGKFSIAPIAALALTIGGFFPRMGAASTFIWAFVAAAGAGLCVVLLQKGETEDAEKQDFRVRQDA